MQNDRTIDDSQLANSVTNVTYYNPDSNSGRWSSESDCSTCIVNLSISAVMNRTYHYIRTNLTGGGVSHSFGLVFPGNPLLFLMHPLLLTVLHCYDRYGDIHLWCCS
jgi:hypothetical protein